MCVFMVTRPCVDVLLFVFVCAFENVCVQALIHHLAMLLVGAVNRVSLERLRNQKQGTDVEASMALTGSSIGNRTEKVKGDHLGNKSITAKDDWHNPPIFVGHLLRLIQETFPA